MECSTVRSSIEETAGIVREASFKEKNNLSNEELTNQVLDKILELKKVISDKVSQIEKITVQIEELTWFDIDQSDVEIKQKINDLISSSRDWSKSLIKNRDKCVDNLKEAKVTISELSDWNNAIDDLIDTTNTLEKAIFFYPVDEDFKRITDELSRI